MKYTSTSIMYINLAPLLLNLMNCFTTLLFYESIDLGEIVYPVSLFRVGFPYKWYDCNITAEEIAQLHRGVYGEKWSRICRSVQRNFQVKGTNCVGVLSMYPPEVIGESDIYWLLNYYWSRSELQKLNYYGNKMRSSLQVHNFFPSNIKIQTLVTPESFYSRNFVTGPKVWKLEWDLFVRLPKVVICIPKEETKKENYVGKVGFLFTQRPQVYLATVKMNSNSGLNETRLSLEIDKYRKNELGVKVYCHVSKHFLCAVVRRAFNATEKLEWGRVNSLWNIQVDHSKLIPSGPSDTHFMFTRKDSFVVITSCGYSKSSSFGYLVTPYDLYSWICLCLLILLISVLFFIPVKYREIAIRCPSLLVYVLLENPCTVKEKFQTLPVSVIFAVFLLMGIILSNGYKGVVTTSVVKPFNKDRVESLESALFDRNYKNFFTVPSFIYPEFPNVSLWEYCCQTPEGLSHKLMLRHTLKMIQLPPLLECREILSRYRRLDMLFDFDFESSEQIKPYFLELGTNGNLNGVAAENETHSEKIRRKLIHNTVPAECNWDVNPNEHHCKDNVEVWETSDDIDIELLIEMQEYNRNRNPPYKIEDTHSIFKSKTLGFLIHPISTGRERVLPILGQYEQSGIHTHLLTMDSFKHNLIRKRIIRKSLGKSVEEAFQPIAMSMSTNAYYTFLILIYSLTGAFLICIIEMYTVFRIILQQKTYPWIRQTTRTIENILMNRKLKRMGMGMTFQIKRRK